MSSSYLFNKIARDLGISESPRYKASPRESIGERIQCLLDIERDYIEGDAQEIQSLRTCLLLVPAFVRKALAAERPDLARFLLATDLLASSDDTRDRDEPEDTRDRDEADRHETSFASFGLER